MIKHFIIIIFLFISLSGSTNDLKFLTKEEIQWIRDLPRDIKIGITQIPNQILLSKNHNYKGFSIDLFHIIEKKLHLKFQYCYFETWEKLVSAAKKNQVDIIFLAQKTTSRLQYLYFTDTILTLQNKLIVNINNKFHTLDELKKHKLAITSGSALQEYIHYYYPEIIIIPTKNELQSLKYVVSKKADATVLELVRASYYMSKYNLNNLVISSDIEYNYYLSIASSKELPELNLILSKTLKKIKQKEIASLKLKWGYIKEKKAFLDKQTIIYLSIAFGIIIPFSIYLFIINNRLKKEIQEKKKVLERVVKLRDSKLSQMSEIIGIIAHQWRQPLNNLSLLVQLLVSKHKKGTLDDKLMEYFESNSKKQITLMSKTVDDFRNMFQINEEQEVFDLKIMINNLLSVMQPTLNKYKIQIDLHMKDDSYLLQGYQSMLLQIIMNIINNAKDALIESDKEEKIIKITLSRSGNEKVIAIYDNAGGIDEEIIDKIFDPYFSTKKQKNGTGLGLYMSKTIIEERMKGKITVRNEKEGALFEIRLT